MAGPGNRCETGEVRAAGMRVHRKFYCTSVLRTLAFYGAVLALCLVFPLFVALGIVLFTIRFYRAEMGRFLRHPIQVLFLRTPPEFTPYSFEVFPPGSFGYPEACAPGLHRPPQGDEARPKNCSEGEHVR